MRRKETVFWAGVIIFVVMLGGCGLLSKPAPKMEPGETTGGTGEDRAFLERFSPAPREFYDIDESAAALFGALAENEWENAGQALIKLRRAWQEVQSGAAEKARAAGGTDLDRLAAALAAQKASDACRNLNRFMANVAKISEDYQLSPVSDIISVGIAVRETGICVAEEDWEKAAAKSKELENVWNQSKPALEQMGVMGRLTKAHSFIYQMKDAIDAENKEVFLENSGKIAATFQEIRQFYYGK